MLGKRSAMRKPTVEKTWFEGEMWIEGESLKVQRKRVSHAENKRLAKADRTE